MNKIDKELYIKHAKRLAGIINPASPFAKYLARPDFISRLKLELNVLASLEKMFADDSLAAELKTAKIVADFNTITNADFKVDENFKYEDGADYIDAINYLHTYCKNIYKVDIDELAEGKKVDVSSPEINLGADAKADAGMGAAGGMPFMGAMGDMAGMPGMEGMMNPFAYGNAAARLNKEIKEGKVYQYKTKPEVIPVIKKICSIFAIIISLAFLVTAVFVFITNGLEYKNSTGAIKNASFITNGIFYLITACFGIYLSITTLIQQAKSKDNDNLKYQFTWFIYFGLILLATLIPLLDLPNTWLINVEITDTTIRKTIGLAVWKWAVIIDPILAALLVIPVIIGGVKAPKVDEVGMQAIIADYMKEFIEKQGSFATTGVNPDGTDVQKPVDVKPSEEKKDDSKVEEATSNDVKPDDTNLKS